MVSLPSLVRRRKPATRTINRSRRLLLELLEDRTAPAGLVLSLASYEVPEGLVTTGTVTRTDLDMSQPMTVWLYSSDTTEATVPQSVIIPEGQASADFPIIAQDDDETDASMSVTIHAEASVPDHFRLLTASAQIYMTRTIATLPDGRYVTAGLKYIGQSFDVAVSRFLPTGQLDSSFSGGVVVTPVAPERYDTPTVILPQSDGKILVAGHSAPEWATTETDMFVVRFNTDGTLDNTFGVGGIVLLDSPEGYRAEVLDLTFGPNGSIYLAGTLDRFDGNFADFAVVRLTAAGDYDLSWGGTGVVTTDFFYDDAIYEAVPQSNKLLVVGQAGANGSGAKLALARYNTNGTLDNTFGSGGKVTLDVPGFNEVLTDFIYRPDGKILAVGTVQPYEATPTNPNDWLMVQFNADGTLDPSFGFGGVITYDFGGDDQATVLQQMTNDTFAVAGFGVGNIENSDRKPVLVQFTPGGHHMLRSVVLQRPDTLAYDLIYQDNKLRVAGTSSSAIGGFVDTYFPASAGLVFADETLHVIDTDATGPVVEPDAYDVGEDETFEVFGFGVLGNDYSPNGELTASLVSGPAHGALNLSPMGGFTYAPDPNYFGPDSFVYRATDPLGLTADATVSLTVWNMDDPIVLNLPGAQTTAEDTPLTFSAANGNAITIVDIESPRVLVALLVQNGILTLPSVEGIEFYPDTSNNSPTFAFYADTPAEANAVLNGLIFTPAPNFNGSTLLDVLVRDETYVSFPIEDYGSVPITVTPVNDAPIAVADSYETWEDYVLTITAPSQRVLGNDSDPDGNPLSAVLVSGPAHGALSLNTNGSFTYTPHPNYNGQDSFVYRAVDPAGLGAQATATITIWEMDDPIQVTGPGPQTIDEDTSLTFSTANGNALTVIDLESPPVLVALLAGYGILTLPSIEGIEFYPGTSNNSPTFAFYADNPAEANAVLNGLVFTPLADFWGPAYVDILVHDETFVSFPMEDFEHILIDVAAVNDTPVAVDDSYAAHSGVPFVTTNTGGGDGPGVLLNDQDVDGDILSAALVSGPEHGTLTFNANGTFTYTAEATYVGADAFTYIASDGELESGVATVTFTITRLNHAPVATNDSYSVDEDVVLTIAAPGVLGNDTDANNDALSAILVSGPSHGALSLNADGSFTYTPSANYNGSDSFTYKANDGELDSNATVAITVNSIDDAPVAVDDAYSLNEDQKLTIAPVPGVTSLTMVSEPGDWVGQGLTYSFTPQDGTFTATRNFDEGVSVHFSKTGSPGIWWDTRFAAADEVELTAGFYDNATRWPFQDPGEPGLDVSGEGRGSNTLTGNFTVTQALYAADGKVLRFAATFEQHSEGAAPALTGEIKFNEGDGPSGILLNDSDAEGSPLTIIIVSNPAHGTLSMNVDGSFIYTPNANYHGADSFTYKVSDGVYESNIATVSLTINSVNDFPTANNDTYVVVEDNVLTVAAPGVLSNDSDIDGDSLTATQITSPTNGTLVFNVDGSFVYTPNANYNGSDSFKYAARDSTGAFSFIRTVTLIVVSVNDAPTATADSYTTAEDTPLTVAAPGVLGNDTDVEGTSLTAVLVGGPAHGSLTLNSNGSFTYTPAANYNGPDSFTYKARDGGADSNIVAVSLTVTAVADAPTATDDAYSVDEDSTLTVAAPGVLDNDSDGDGDSLSAVLVSEPAHGTLSFNADGSFTYTPAANYHGGDSFTYKANDGASDSNVATVSLTINPVNDAPTATDDAHAVDEDNTLTVPAPGLLGNDGDIDGDSLSAVLLSGPAHGSLNLNADGSFTYTPDANYHGSDNFTYKANDGAADSNVATVSLTINPVNDAPTAAANAHTVNEDSTLTVAAPGVLGNDGDVDGDSLSVLLVSGPAHGTLNLNADGSFTYTPDANYNGSDSFTYKANDGAVDSNVVTVSLTINAVNDAPSAVAGPDAQNGEGGTATFDASGSFDIDGDALTYLWDFGDGNTASGQIVQYAHADQGTYTVTLTVSDGVASTSDTMIMTVINGAPLAVVSGPASGVRGQARTFTFGADDPSSVDDAAGFSFSIDWGDGSQQTVNGLSGQQVDHVYAANGTYWVRATATEKDGGVSSIAEQSISIVAVELQDGDLVVGGTTSGDTINLKVADQSGGVKVTINGALQGTFNPTGRILVYAQAGIDNVKFETTKFTGQTWHVQDDAVVQGGDGNDTLDARGSSANNVLVGGAGNDTIWGGLGRDLLLGGTGVDTLRAGQGEDLLVGNSTVHDNNLTALLALMAEWGRTDADYAERAAHLSGTPGGLNGGAFLNSSTVTDDAAIDQLYGESGLDLFFVTDVGTNKDRVNDLAGGELKVAV